MTRSARTAALLVLAVVAAACGGASSAPLPTAGGVDATTFAAALASTDLFVGAPQRVQIGVFSSTPDAGVALVTSGTISVVLAPFQDGDGTPVEATARYIAAPGTAGSDAGAPALTSPSDARGVYQMEASFDEAGIWQADVAVGIDGDVVALATQFQVLPAPALPAPGDRALRTSNLTATDRPAAAVDSRAAVDGLVPDVHLHTTTIADALRRGIPALVLFATPAFCQSQFCGPDVEWLAQLADERPTDAAYIHVEIWADFEAQEVNEAALDWLYRDGELTEPWLYLIDADGRIADRWSPLFDPAEVEAALDAATA